MGLTQAATPGGTSERPPWRRLAILGTVAACLLVWFLRRPDQFHHPYVWAEEFLVLNRFQEAGFWKAAFHPYQGYLLLPASASISFAAVVSLQLLPALNYWLSTIWFVLTLLLILVPASDVGLPYRVAMAGAVTLSPASPEVFGVLLNSFWWTTLWPLIALMWRKEHTALRTLVTAIGGLSSLAGAALAVPVGLSYAISRRRSELVAAVVLVACLGAQSLAYLVSTRASEPVAPADIALQSLRNLSWFTLAWARPSSGTLAAAGAAMAMALVAMTIRAAANGPPVLRRLAVSTAAATLLVGLISAIPAPLVTHPLAAGPRYYFLPFAALAWLLVLLCAATESSGFRILALLFLLLGALNVPRTFSRDSDVVEWRAQLRSCSDTSGDLFVPVHTSGRLDDMWLDGLRIIPSTCRRLDAP